MTGQSHASATLSSIAPLSFSTARLTLERFDESTDEHYNCILAVINNPVAYETMGDLGIKTKKQFDDLNSGTLLHPGIMKIKGSTSINVDIPLYYMARLKSSVDAPTPLIGAVSLCQRTAQVPPDVGWCFLPGYHGHGYASEAAVALLEMARTLLGIREVMVWPGAENKASIRTAEKSGFVYGGTANDAVVYILPGMDWKKISSQRWSLHGDASA